MSFFKNLFGNKGNDQTAASQDNSTLPSSDDLLGNLSMEAAEKLKQNASEAQKNVAQTITSIDHLGRRIEISREKWGQEILPQLIKENIDKPDVLFETINRAIELAFHAEVADAAQTLKSIDSNGERGSCVLAMVQALNGQAATAVSSLEAYLESNPFSHNAMCTLARIYFQADENEKAYALVDKAVSLEPNQPEPLAWHYSAVLEKDGLDAAKAEMQRLAEIPDSYRPALILGKLCLEAKENEQALKWFKKSLDFAPENVDVMTALTGEMGKAGLHEEIFELCLPAYRYDKHGGVPGCNIIQSMIVVGKVEEAENLLHMLCRVAPDNLRRVLMQLSGQLNNIHRQAYMQHLQENPPKQSKQVEFMRLRRPLWFYPLNDPEWLLPPREDNSLRLHFTSLSLDLPENANAQQKDALAGISFSAPIFFMEMMISNPAISPGVYLPVMEGTGPVINTSPWPKEHLTKIATLDEETPDFLIDGSLGCTDKEIIVTMRLNNTSGDTLNEVRRSGPWGELPKVLCDAADEIIMLATENSHKMFQEKPNPQLIGSYLQMTSHLLGQFMVMRQIIPPQMLSGRREMLEGLYAFAVNSGPADMPKLMFMAGLEYEKSMAGRTQVEFEHRAMTLASLAEPGSTFHRCVPHFLKTFGRLEEVKQLITQVPDEAPEDYRDWLKSDL